MPVALTWNHPNISLVLMKIGTYETKIKQKIQKIEELRRMLQSKMMRDWLKSRQEL